MILIPINDGNSNFDLVEMKAGYPHCKIHGAMAKVSPGSNGLWRCLTTSETECRAGAKQNAPLPKEGAVKIYCSKTDTDSNFIRVVIGKHEHKIEVFNDTVVVHVYESGEKIGTYYDYNPKAVADQSQEAQRQGAAKVVCYCGSLRVAMEAFKKAEYEAVLRQEIALLPCCMFVDIQREYGAESDYKVKADELHKRKIDICDEVFVLNVGGYIGESTRNEINYAESVGKPVKYLEPSSAL